MSRPRCVLILEGPVSAGFSQILRQDDYYVRPVADAQQLLAEIHLADIIVVDTLRPDLTVPVYRRMESRVNVPLLMLAPAADADFSISLLRVPFTPETLHERVDELLTKPESEAKPSEVVHVGNLTVDLKGQRVLRDEVSIKLSPTELRLLAYFAQRVGQAVSYDKLLTEVWGYELGMGDRNLVTNAMQRLRHKLEENAKQPRYVVTIRGVGYRLRNQEQFEKAMRGQ